MKLSTRTFHCLSLTTNREDSWETFSLFSLEINRGGLLQSAQWIGRGRIPVFGGNFVHYWLVFGRCVWPFNVEVNSSRGEKKTRFSGCWMKINLLCSFASYCFHWEWEGWEEDCASLNLDCLALNTLNWDSSFALWPVPRDYWWLPQPS